MKDGEEVTSDGAAVIYDISEDDLSGIAGYELSDTGEILDSPEDASADDTEATEEPSDVPTEDPEATEDADGTDSADATETSENVGEAVLVSSTISAEYFDAAKLSREQTRSKNKEILMELINSTTTSEAQKEDAVSEVISLTADSEKETAAETMLEAKGFGQCIVSIVEGKVDVIVNANDLTVGEIAQIEDIVKRKTDVEAANIVITPVGVSGK